MIFRLIFGVLWILVVGAGSLTAREAPLGSHLNPFIMSQGILSESTLVSFILKHNNRLDHAYVARVVRAYVRESAHEGVNHDIAISQMLLETGYLSYKGQVASHQNNFGGIGALDSGESGASFASIEEGVRAHIQHLKAYASTQDVKGEMIDPRFYLVKRGSARTFYDLTGRWATDTVYDKKIAFILDRILTHHEENESLALSF
jgi:hypothetical protein